MEITTSGRAVLVTTESDCRVISPERDSSQRQDSYRFPCLDFARGPFYKSPALKNTAFPDADGLLGPVRELRV